LCDVGEAIALEGVYYRPFVGVEGWLGTSVRPAIGF